MDNKIKNIMGLLDGGKRVYQVKDGEVDADHFKYCAVLTEILFGKRGLVETLGPTWEMVHDPRFEKIENLFVIQKTAMFGGDAREGIQVQTADGTFTNSFAGLQQYAEMLGEGRYLIAVLQNFAIVEALDELFPERSFRTEAMDSLGALKLVVAPYPGALQVDLANAIYNELSKEERTPATLKSLGESSLDELWASAKTHGLVQDFFAKRGFLSPEERIQVKDWSQTFPQYNPHAVETWNDDRVWGLIRIEYPNYFSRKGVPNQDAKTLFAIVKGGLLGLVSDYAEVANVQENVLLEDPNTLYDPAKHGEDAPRVSMEIDLIERALTYRAELRVTAAQILNSLGIASRMPEVTDFERDQMLKIVYQSKWPIDKTEMITKLLGFTYTITLSGKNVEERRFQQLTDASILAKKYVAGLKDGSITPINRETDGTEETSVEDSEKIIENVLGNPLFAHLFMRYSNLEGRLLQAKTEFLLPTVTIESADLLRLLTSPTEILDQLKVDYPAFNNHLTLVDQWIASATDNSTVVIPPYISDGQMVQLNEINRLARATGILAPPFTETDYQLTEEGALELFAKVEEIDPTPKPTTAQYEGTLDEENRLPEPTVQ